MAEKKQDVARSSETDAPDFIPRLPTEIILIISELLGLTDFIILCRVSKSWRTCWSNGLIYSHLIKDRFRNYYEIHDVSTDGGNSEKAFRALTYEQYKMQRGRYYSMAIYSYDGQDYDGDEDSLCKTYHNGRAAWHIHTVVKVTTLVTGITRQYLNSDNAPVCSFWLGKDLLVAEPYHRAKLYVWFLDTDTTFDIEIPSRSKHITLCNDQIGIVTERNVVIWTASGGMQEPLGHIATTDPVPEAVLFHPTSRGTIILVSSRHIHPTDPKHNFTLRLLVQEYTNGTIGNSCFLDMPFLRHLADFERVEFDIRPIDENGIYSVCWIFDDVTDLSNVSHACRLKRHDGNISFYHLLCYDMYRKELTMRCFADGIDTNDNTQLQVPPGEFCTSSQVWAGQMLTPVIGAGSTCRQFLFQTVIEFDQVSTDPPSIRYIDGIGDSSKAVTCNNSVVDERGQAHGLLSYFIFESETQPGREPWDWVSWSRAVRGDGRFLVLLAEHGYIVWCLEKGDILPSVHQLSKEVLVYRQ